jgi:hypothetical protein
MADKTDEATVTKKAFSQDMGGWPTSWKNASCKTAGKESI